MKVRKPRLVLTFLAIMAVAPLALPLPATAQGARATREPDALSALARIEAITRVKPDDVLILRRDGHRSLANVYDRLYRGDRILMAGQQTSIGLRRRNGAGIETVRARDQSEIVFDGADPAPFTTSVQRLFARLGFWYSRGPALPQVHAARNADSLAQTVPPARLTRAFAPVQYLTNERETVLVYWRGSATRAGLAPAGTLAPDALIVVGRRAARLTVPRVEQSGSVLITDDAGRTVRIRLMRRPRPPRIPGWISGLESRAERELAMAGWLTLDGPREWRLEGASRLAELAESDLTARILWEAFLSSQERS